jgi:tetratricopeptide (TPR) repeat protein
MTNKAILNYIDAKIIDMNYQDKIGFQENGVKFNFCNKEFEIKVRPVEESKDWVNFEAFIFDISANKDTGIAHTIRYGVYTKMFDLAEQIQHYENVIKNNPEYLFNKVNYLNNRLYIYCSLKNGKYVYQDSLGDFIFILKNNDNINTIWISKCPKNSFYNKSNEDKFFCADGNTLSSLENAIKSFGL